MAYNKHGMSLSGKHRTLHYVHNGKVYGVGKYKRSTGRYYRKHRK